MIGSAYSRISKAIGLGPKQVALPSAYKARLLVSCAREGEESAFMELFNIYRHRESPSTDSELQVINIVAKGFQDTQNIFRNMP